MDLREKLLDEARKLEAKASKMREAAKVLGKGGVERQRKGHRAQCAECKRPFLTYVTKFKAGGPFCSGACRSKARRERLGKELMAKAVRGDAKGRRTVLVKGDGVSQ